MRLRRRRVRLKSVMSAGRMSGRLPILDFVAYCLRTWRLLQVPAATVCIVPAAEVDEAVQLAKQGKVMTCFGDLLRVPCSDSSLLQAKAEGADVRIVYAVSDAIEMAKKESEKRVCISCSGL